MVQDGSKLDMVRNFSQLHQETVLNQAKSLWNNPNATIERHLRGTDLYNSRLLAVFLMNALMTEFTTNLHSRIDQDFSTDGPLLLFTMCNHIHRNHLAFVDIGRCRQNKPHGFGSSHSPSIQDNHDSNISAVSLDLAA